MIHGMQPPGFRLPDDTRIGRVALRVRDLDRSLEFYRDLLGFSVHERAPGRTLLGAGSQTLIELHAGATQPRTQRRLGLYHFAILLPERSALGACLRHLIDNSIQPGAADHLVSEALYLQDPDGLGIEIYRDRAREEWRVVGKQLAMASDPLDFEGVLEAGRDRSWTGMPAGTTIGHVHLHVGDLNNARRFYHEALGLDLVVWSYPGALFLAAGGYHHHLGVNTWSGPSAVAQADNEAQLLWWDLVLPTSGTVQAATDSLKDADQRVVAQEPGGYLVEDPWGTKVRLTTVV